MGIVEQFEHPKFVQAMERVAQACRKANIAMALQSDNMDLLLRARAVGVRMLMYSSDIGVLLRGYREGLARLRG
jgi:2-keto-3-deoxy-L-rhamnonate aldolase RhmA